MSTFFFLMDAMRSDYINNNDTPFLFDCSAKNVYYKKVIPNFGFCERTEILTGQTPSESGFFTAIGFDPSDSPFKNIRGLGLLIFLDEKIPRNINNFLIPKGGNLYNLFRKLINKWVIFQTGISPQNIPIRLLKYWALTEDKIDHRDEKAFNVPSILSLMKEANKTYFYDSFSALNIPHNGSDINRLNMAINDKKVNNRDFYMIYISTPDFYGHEYGPKSLKTKKALKNLDGELKRFVKNVMKLDEDSSFIFLGDHGMADVKNYFDIEKKILKIAGKLNMKLCQDYIYFLDSTLARIWFFNDDLRIPFEIQFAKNHEISLFGKIIDSKIAEKEAIPWKDKRYGDLIWWANTGNLIFPDFFHRTKKYKGMHGYDVNQPENNGMCIIKSDENLNIIKEKIHLVDIFTILKRMLSL